MQGASGESGTEWFFLRSGNAKAVGKSEEKGGSGTSWTLLCLITVGAFYASRLPIYLLNAPVPRNKGKQRINTS